MRPLSDHDKRQIRRATVFIAVYILLFGGFKMWHVLEKRRLEYQQLVTEAKDLRFKIRTYQDKAVVVKKTMEELHLDPAKLSSQTIVGQASSAIQKAASASGIQVGAIRETAVRESSDEIASMRFEGSGPVPAVTGMLDRMHTLGYPLVIDSVQITPDNRPGNVKVSLTIIILDFEKWQNPEASHA